MGCNTSQELKTKEGSLGAINGTEQNDENAVTEQNASNEVPELVPPLMQPKCASNAVCGAEAAAVANDELQINKTVTASLTLLHANNTHTKANGNLSPNNIESLDSTMNASNLKANHNANSVNTTPAKENGNAVIVPNGHDSDAILSNKKTIEMNGHGGSEKMEDGDLNAAGEEEGKTFFPTQTARFFIPNYFHS